MSAPLAFIDTETDGVHPDRRVWEVAIIRRDEAGERERHFFVATDLRTADPFGLQVGRFYERHPMGIALTDPDRSRTVKVDAEFGTGVVLTEKLAAFEVARWTHGAHLVGAVPNFDADCLDKMLRRHGLIPAWHYHLIDVEAMAVGWLRARGGKFNPPWKSDELSTCMGIEPPSESERHTAMGDARWAMRWYDAMTAVAS